MFGWFKKKDECVFDILLRLEQRITDLESRIGIETPAASESTPVHMRPRYHGYTHGTFDNVNYCTECDRHGLYEDMHSVNPCPSCGGKVAEGLVGKWNKSTKKWEMKL